MTEMEQQDCVDWKGFINDHKLTPNNQEGKKVLLKDVHYMKFRWGEKREMKHDPDEAWVRFSLNKDEPWKKLKIVWPRQVTTSQSAPHELYQRQVPLKVA